MSEGTPLVSNAQAGAVASGAATLINQSAAKIKKARMEGPLTFRTLGFIGGLAMIVSNALGIFDRFFSFNFSGSLTAVYGVLFGVLSKWDETRFVTVLTTVVIVMKKGCDTISLQEPTISL
jgi:hypothetical protein